MKPIRVYVAGPLTQGNREENVRTALDAASRLLDAGFAPYVPHLSHYWDAQTPRPYETWMALDFAWLEACDVFLRLPGHSPGADREETMAADMGIPRYYEIGSLVSDLEGRRHP